MSMSRRKGGGGRPSKAGRAFEQSRDVLVIASLQDICVSSVNLLYLFKNLLKSPLK